VHADASEKQPTNNALPLSTSQKHTSALDGGSQLHDLTTLLLGTNTDSHRIREAAWALEPLWAFGEKKNLLLYQHLHTMSSSFQPVTILAGSEVKTSIHKFILGDITNT
jgi:hypothetical protein